VLPRRVWRALRAVGREQTGLQRTARRARIAAAQLPGPQGWRQPTTRIDLEGRAVVALTTEQFRSSAALAEHLSMVADALEAGGVDYFVLVAEPERRRVVVVPASERKAAVAALTKGLRGSPTYVARVRGTALDAPRLIGRSGMPRGNVLRLFHVYASTSGGFLGGPTLGCDVEFWQEAAGSPAGDNGEAVPAGALLAPRRNPWVDIVRPDQRTARRVVDGHERTVLSTLNLPHLFTVTQPIDVVYTWVDGSDPDWILRKAAAQDEHLTRATVMHALAANDSRFASRDELRYSLRSLDMYADWVNHVYLVTDDQVPPWLDTSHPRLTVVSHKELFGDRGVLPTFNSHAIETQLHHIEGLSEQYLYLNDDVFFGRPVSPSLFFHSNGLARFQTSHAKIGLGSSEAEDMPVMSAAKNNRDLIAHQFGRTIANKFKHVPHALRRSVMTDLEQEFAEDFKRTAASQFRNHADVSVSASLGHYYGYITGRAVPGSLRYFYADIAREDTPSRLEELLRRRNFDVFCLNDHDSSSMSLAMQTKLIEGFLGQYFPQPSSFERPDSMTNR
jgi:hypothetical protein